VVGDGAMGTMLYARGVFVNRCFDELNLSNPALVRSVHEEYLEAGADIVRDQHLRRHRFKLGPHGFDQQVRKINREGARVAREAVQGRAGGGIGGTAGQALEPLGNITFDEAVVPTRSRQRDCRRRRRPLRHRDHPRPRPGPRRRHAVRAVSALPITVSMTFTEEGTTFYGDTPEDVERRRRRHVLGVQR